MKKILLIVLSFSTGIVASAVVVVNILNKILIDKQAEKEKFRIMYQMMERWMRIKQRGDNLRIYFESHGYKEIAVYGMGDIGKRLLQELKGGTIKVGYGIDRNILQNSEVKVVTPDEITEEADAVIVTAIAYFDDIYEVLSQKMSCPIISLEDIVYEVV